MRATIAAVLLFAILTLILTYPLPLHLAQAVEDRQDALLNVWITAWDGHQLLTSPLHLFDANIFFPYPRTLAYSELLLGNALLALPLTAATGNPVLSYNVALLLSFFLSGVGAYLLVVRLTARAGAGIVAGILFAFSSYRLSNLAQAQLLATQWLPFSLLALHQFLRQPRLRDGAAFVLFFWLQTVSSFYYGLLLALAVAAYLAFDLARRALTTRRSKAAPERFPRRPLLPPWASPGAAALPSDTASGRCGAGVPRGVSVAACCLLLLLPFVVPYFRVQRELGFERALAESEPFSASLRQYVRVPPGSVLPGLWLAADAQPRAGGYPADALFPGVVALLLGAWGLARGRNVYRWFYALLGVAAFILSLGPRLYLAPGEPAGLGPALPYAWLYAVIPGFKALRAPVRFDVLVSLALAVLAGHGAAELSERLRGSTIRQAGLAAVLAGLAAAELVVWPAARATHVPVGEQVPPVYRWLAEQPPGPVLELPMAFTDGGPQLDYQYLSTYHWQPSPDGYSGFVPPTHGQIVYEMERFPSERSISLLQGLGVQYIVIHGDRYPAERLADMEAVLAQSADVASLTRFGEDRVYRVRERETRGGVRWSWYLPPRAPAGQPYAAYLIGVNDGRRSYALQPTSRFLAVGEWANAQPNSAKPVAPATVAAVDFPLVTSPGGGVAVIPFVLDVPLQPGSYRLRIGDSSGVPGEAEGAESVIAVGGEGAASLPVPARLAGWSVPPAVRPGESLPVRLTWQALGKIDAYYSVYVKLIDGQGNAVAGWDGQPRGGQAPTLEWVPGETIDDVVTLPVPADAAPGGYTVQVGMYRAEDLATCLLIGDGMALLERVSLGMVKVQR